MCVLFMLGKTGFRAIMYLHERGEEKERERGLRVKRKRKRDKERM